jgi:hypothetical protein
VEVSSVKVEPSQPRWRLEEGAGSLTFVIPARRHWLVLLFLSLWILGWAIGELLVPARLLGRSREAGENLFMVVWLVAWTLGGLVAIYLWLWNLAGREIVTVREGTLAIRRAIDGLGRSREFDAAHIEGLRVASQLWNPWDPASRLRFWGVGGGTIAFDYGATTYRFGGALEEAEARQMVARLARALPAGATAPENPESESP